MKKNDSEWSCRGYHYFLLVAFYVFFLFGCQTIPEKNIVLNNGKLKMEFDRYTGALKVLEDIEQEYNFLDTLFNDRLPWEIVNGEKVVGRLTDFTGFRYSKSNSHALVLTWEGVTGVSDEPVKVTATVRLGKDEAVSYWKIAVNASAENKIDRVSFPVIAGIKEMKNEELAVPQWMGQLMKNPRATLAKSKRFDWFYPGPLSMQCLALYNPNHEGLFLSCNDSLSFVKKYSLVLDTLNTLTFQMDNFPAVNADWNHYEPSYETVIGTVKGDWITVAEKYRDWGEKQKWCKTSRLTNNKIPAWLEKTNLWVWNRGRSGQVLTPATKLKERLDLPVSVLWHWWHGCSYDDGFPEYLPPREGAKSFTASVALARKQGVNSIVYMNQLLWGTSTDSWKNENASRYSVKKQNGEMNIHTFNIFTGKSVAYMCMATPFWRDKYTSLCDRVVNSYKTSGVYMDMACLNSRCYDPSHGHALGGGNYWVSGFGKLTQQIRATISDETHPVLAGEGCGESWLPYLDAFLTLQVSRERYAGLDGWETIPFFQAVYHPYAITYGNYSSLLSPPYDEKWPDKYKPKEQLQLLDPVFNKQFLMEQAKAFVWGMQPTIANYQDLLADKRKTEIEYLLDIARLRKQGEKYLLKGKFSRSPDMEIPMEELSVSRLSIYAGREEKSVTKFKEKCPLIYSGTWRAEDNSIGIALASISDNRFPVEFILNTKEYGIPPDGKIYLMKAGKKSFLTGYNDGKVQVQFFLEPEETCIVEIIPSLNY